MISELSNEKQRTLALSLLALCLVLVVGLIITPIMNSATTDDEAIEDLKFTLRRYQKIVAGKDQIGQQTNIIRARQKQDGYFINRETPALASADLQQLIKKVVVDAGGQLISTQVVSNKGQEQFKTSIKVRLSGSTQSLLNILYGIETATPLLIIDKLMIKSTGTRRNRRTGKRGPSGQINVNFDVHGYMWSKRT
ncbi:MAG: general secretion pathway protein GspM [Methylococcus sp.]|nr:MAG: general secretion pathway protein GspM [Methylococcus sp.]